MSELVGEASRIVAGEVRAEMGRQAMTTRALAQRLGIYDVWVSRRISPTADVAMTVDELVRMADALDCPLEQVMRPLLAATADNAPVTVLRDRSRSARTAPARAPRATARRTRRDSNSQPSDLESAA